MNSVELKQMLKYMSQQLVKSEPLLTRVDQAIGDGDHGLGIERGFQNTYDYLEQGFEANDVGTVFSKVGTKLLTTMGGASGAIFGTLFRNGGKAVVGETELTTKVLATFLAVGLAGIKQRGGADEGAKTMIDALAPAARKAQELSDLPLEQALPSIVQAAQQGVEDTKDMIATTGKAKTLGERSLGYPDPGAISMSLMLQFMDDYIEEGATV
ncbi:dihydroxyacetone kinase subunit L [Vibrio sp. 10N.286.49.C2]|uniref:dihydroxyacetone kinase subunit DhaL n=1 Tax=unclassified Vibrio TaxID=2614977 RepID=UPI000C851EC7|nr:MULTISPECIES: dihydroxyacetone kinase subunit DhaL [unclassified Vibrio]PMH43418.1 dihydroxyacetone kinase subunit L [Vibrio sp. 10N.286.49.C2]PMH57070.1 dihydroxyacetone kinase subunit L [Vibrio sp. 10N.286.49.B1]PMH78550.1 dihydroxyacetone kinase subunit L [Vibrio sp. 10N.286.48.B7]